MVAAGRFRPLVVNIVEDEHGDSARRKGRKKRTLLPCPTPDARRPASLLVGLCCAPAALRGCCVC